MYYYVKYIDNENYAFYASSTQPKKVEGLKAISDEEYQKLLKILEAKINIQEEEQYENTKL